MIDTCMLIKLLPKRQSAQSNLTKKKLSHIYDDENRKYRSKCKYYQYICV